MNSSYGFLAFALALVVSIGATQQGQRVSDAGQPSSTAAQPTAIADDFLREFVVAIPLAALYLGIPNAPNDTLGDNSIEGAKRWQVKEDEWLRRLKQVRVSDLSVSDQVTYGTLLELLQGSVETRICREELWPLNQQSGLQVTLAELSQLQPIGTDQLRSDALKRWHAIPRFIDTEIQTLQEGLRQRYTLPQENVKAIIAQLDDLLKMPPSSSPFAALGDRDPSPGFADAVRDVVAHEIMPALARYRDFLRNEYLAKARAETAIAALPHGSDCYRARVRRYATLDMAPDAVHQLGLDQMQVIEQQMLVIGRRAVGAEDVSAIVQRLRSDPKYKFETREQI